MSFRAAFLFVGGFLNRRDDANGLYEAFLRTYRAHAAGDVLVQYLPWLVDPDEVATAVRLLHEERLEERGEALRIAVAGYSFGGYTAAEICQALDWVPVEELLLCDPVARWFGRVGWSRALFPGTIPVPANVQRVHWVRQRNPKLRLEWPFLFPRSHRVATSERTKVNGPWTVLHEHTEIDNSEQTQAWIDLIAEKIAAPEKPPLGFQSPPAPLLTLFDGDDV